MAIDDGGRWAVGRGQMLAAIHGRSMPSMENLVGAGRLRGPQATQPGHPPQWVLQSNGLRLPLALLLALALLLIPTLVAADSLDDQVRAIAKELRCPVCSGESVADSNAQVSVQMRGIIRQKLEAGENSDQIKAYFVERYGASILLSPEAKGFTLGVWVAPIVALVVGLAIVLTVLRSWLRRAAPVSAAPAPAPAVALPADEDERLEQELAHYRRSGGGVRG